MSPTNIQNNLTEGLELLLRDQPLLELAHAHNEWFLPELVGNAIQAVMPWFNQPLPPTLQRSAPESARIGIVMAGNLPLVGLHDLFMVLLAGHEAKVKTSSKDALLMRRLVSQLKVAWQSRITFVDDLDPAQLDFLIATGSNNTARYLQQRYATLPRLIRKNRFSVAILRGGESPEELRLLAQDILMYHGMGCRSVSNLLVRKGMDLAPLQAAIAEFPTELLAEAWFKVVGWENATRQMLDPDHVVNPKVAFEWKGELQTVAVGVINLVEWEEEVEITEMLALAAEQLQCRVGSQELPFGKAQFPDVADFADDVNTFELLLAVKPGSGKQ